MMISPIIRKMNQVDAAVGRVISQMQWLVGFLCAEVRTLAAQRVIKKVPVERRPGIVQHPLNDAGGLGELTSGVGFEHRPMTVIGEHLRFTREIVKTGWRTVTVDDRPTERIQLMELVLSGVEEPSGSNGPHFIREQKIPQGIGAWRSRTYARLGVEAERTTVTIVDPPIGRRHIIVGARHLYAGWTDEGRFITGRSDIRIWPILFLQNPQIEALGLRIGGIVATIKPRQNTRMVAQSAQLGSQRSLGDGHFPISPSGGLFPCRTASPTR